MIQNVLQSIGGIGIYGIISICLFFAMFIGILIWALRLKKPYLKSMSDLPLNHDEIAPPTRSPNLVNPESRHE
jgi:hypothetical protein